MTKELMFSGRKAELVVEVELKNSTLRIPVTDLSSWEIGGSFDTVTVPLGFKFKERLWESVKEARYRFDV